MSSNSFAEPQKRTTLLLPILVGGAVAGTLDQIAAFVSSGFNVPRVVAAGLLGPQIILLVFRLLMRKQMAVRLPLANRTA